MDYTTGRRYQQARATMQSEHAAVLAEKQREEEERRQANDAARDAYLARLEDERAAAAKKREQEIDAQLEPTKIQERRRWLADHPDKTEADFEKVWTQQLRPYHIEAARQGLIEKTAQQLRSTGMYGI